MNPEELRLFFAVELPSEVRREVASRILEFDRSLAADVRWVSEQNLHLTLKFLGDFAAGKVAGLSARAQARIAGLPRFDVVLGGLGAFPNARKARIVWLDVIRGGASVARLAHKLETVSAKLGVARDPRVYRAHLTIGRCRQPASLALARAENTERHKEISFPVDEVVLYESRLSSTGARYVPQARLPLREPDSFRNGLAPEI